MSGHDLHSSHSPQTERFSSECAQDAHNFLAHELNSYEKLLLENYKYLHESTWENHRISWTVTNIFIPILFTGTGFVFYDAFPFQSRNLSEYSIYKAIFVGLLGESLVAIWWFLMQMLENYNDTRRKRLQRIEEYFAYKYASAAQPPLLQYQLKYSPKLWALKWPFSWICNFIVVAYVFVVSLFVFASFLQAAKLSASSGGSNIPLGWPLLSIGAFLILSWAPFVFFGVSPWIANRSTYHSHTLFSPFRQMFGRRRR